MIYIEHVIVFSLNTLKHLSDANKTIQVLVYSGGLLNFGKCIFFVDTVRYLGLIIKLSRLDVNEAHVRALKLARLPRTVTDLLSFLEFSMSIDCSSQTSPEWVSKSTSS